MEKKDQRFWLKRLQAVLINRADEELPKVVTELGEVISAIGTLEEAPARKEEKGRDRMKRGGRDRKG